MNTFYNPIFLLKILKSYLFDINRLWQLNEVELKKYQDVCFRKIVAYAYTVPLYREKYKKIGIHPNDIEGIKDIEKLPFITKEDIKKYYPEGIISTKTRKDKLIDVSTSGTTGKSLSIYVDMFDIVMGLFGYIRTLREYDINWRKNRISIIGDFATHTVESGYINRGLQPQKNFNFLFKNIQWLDTNDDPKKVIEELNSFQPDFIGGYVGMLGHLALLKQQGLGEKIFPKIIASTGAVLDKFLKETIEKTFNAPVFESYGSTETGPIAFECNQGSYHVMSDFVFLEILKDGKPVSQGEAGTLVVTKLFGKGTPIIRYDAINDIVEPSFDKCTCSMSGDFIKKIYGRDDLSLLLSGGRVLLPSSFAEIYSKILYQLKTTKLKDTRIIQHSKNKIEIQVVIDPMQKNIKPSTEEIFLMLKTGFIKKVGSDVDIIVKEVEKLGDHERRIISKVDKSKFEIKQYI